MSGGAGAGGAPGAAPLSVAQEALWYMSLLAPSRISYNETVSIRKDGPLDVEALRRAFDEVVRRHEAWRTTFDTVGGAPVQLVGPAPRHALPLLDLSDLALDEAERQVVRVVSEASRIPYDLRRGPLLRPRLVRFPGEHHRLYLALHHVIFDGVSVYRVVLHELVALYDAFAAGRPSPLPAPPAQYADYARWEQEWITGRRAARRLAYWREHLDGLPALSLPLDRPRPHEPRHRGGVHALSLSKDAVDRLRAIGQDAGASLFQVLATTWSLLLSRYSGQDDVVFGTAADMRQRPEFQGIVGYCLTPLVLRVDLSGEPTFAGLVLRVRNEVLDGLDHLVPFERLVREVNVEGSVSAGANPIYQTLLVLEPSTTPPDPAWSLHLMEGDIAAAVRTTKVDLELDLDERPDGHLAGRLLYDRDLFDAATIARLAEHWSRLVAAVAADPTLTASAISVLTAAEERRQVVEWNATATDRLVGGVHEHVAARLALQADAEVVSAGGEALSAAELDARAGLVADRLVAAGVAPGDVVACCSEPSVDLIAGVLGVLKAGATYLLLDPDRPTDELDTLIADSGAVALLTAPEPAARLAATRAPVLVLGEGAGEASPPSAPGAGTSEPPPPLAAGAGEAVSFAPGAIAADAVCCLQYTASVEGEVRGVPVRHASVLNVAAALGADLGLGPADTVLVLPSVLYGAPATELWPALLAGARIVVAPAEVAADGARLSALIKAERVSFLHASPSTWQTLVDTGLKASRSLRALSSGEPLSRELADQLLERCRVLWNAYGTAETADYSTLARIERAVPITVGRPIANTRAYVVGSDLRPVPVAVPGELVIAGDGVAAGYRNAPATPFIADPFTTGHAFRTGARARWLPDGRLALA